MAKVFAFVALFALVTVALAAPGPQESEPRGPAPGGEKDLETANSFYGPYGGFGHPYYGGYYGGFYPGYFGHGYYGHGFAYPYYG